LRAISGLLKHRADAADLSGDAEKLTASYLGGGAA
jgi:hypothetical protein